MGVLAVALLAGRADIALPGGVAAARFGITAPFWAGFVVVVIVSAATWRVFDRATVARACEVPYT